MAQIAAAWQQPAARTSSLSTRNCCRWTKVAAGVLRVQGVKNVTHY